MNNQIRQTFASKELALAGAISQMDAIDNQSVELTVEQQQVKHAAMMQARADANYRQDKLDIKLRADRLQSEGITMKSMSDVVYTGRRK